MGDYDREAPVYPIGIVEKLTGLTARQIRYYEQSGLLAPVRTEGRHRLYSPADVDRLAYIKARLEEGLSVAGVKALLSKDTTPAERPKEPSPGANPGASSVVDHASLISQLQAGKPITSLYPVNNQAALVEYLNQVHRHEDSQGAKKRE